MNSKESISRGLVNLRCIALEAILVSEEDVVVLKLLATFFNNERTKIVHCAVGKGQSRFKAILG